MIVPSGEYATINPPQKYISSIASETEIEVPFTVVADQETNLTFHISYQNGDTTHTADVFYPVKFSEDKEEAVPIVNNVGTYFDRHILRPYRGYHQYRYYRCKRTCSIGWIAGKRYRKRTLNMQSAVWPPMIREVSM